MTTGQGRHNPPGWTSTSPERPAQRMAAAFLAFELDHEVAQLRAEPSWLHGDRNAKTLVKEAELRVVLTTMKAGARLPKQQTDARFTIQVLNGHLKLQLPDGTTELGRGQLVALDKDTPHEIEAVEESAFLLTLAWEGGQDGRAGG